LEACVHILFNYLKEIGFAHFYCLIS